MYGQVPLEQRYDGYSQPEPIAEFYVLTTFSAWFGLLAIITTAVVEIFKPDYRPLLALVYLTLVATAAVSVLYCAARWRDGLLKSAMPLAVNVAIGFMVLAMPFGQVWESLTFRLQQGGYHYIAQQVVNGTLQPDANGRVRLPIGYRALSVDGEISVQHNGTATYIFFFAERQAGRQAGYMFRSDHSFPEPLFNGVFAWQHIEQKLPGWYYCATS